MADYGFKVSRDGFDVKDIPDTAARIKQFALLSAIALLKIKTTAKVTLADGANTTIAHGFSYTPIAWVFLKDGNSDLLPVYHNTSDTLAYVDGTNLFIDNQEGATRDFYYYIFYDPV